MSTPTTPTTYVGRVTDSTPSTLEYGTYRGWVEIDGDTGECLRTLTAAERDALELGAQERSAEYANLRPVLGMADTRRLAMELERTEAIRADAAAIAERVGLDDGRSVYNVAVALVQALDDRAQWLTNQLATKPARLRFETRSQREGTGDNVQA